MTFRRTESLSVDTPVAQHASAIDTPAWYTWKATDGNNRTPRRIPFPMQGLSIAGFIL